MAFDERNRSLTVQGKWESIHRPVRMAMAFDERNRSLEQTLETERQSHRNFRNCLSAHTTNGPDAPLWPKGHLASCFHVVPVRGGIEGHLRLPHSFHKDDNLALSVQSHQFPNTKAGEHKSLNQACLRAIIVLLRNSLMDVRLVPANFCRGQDGIHVVQQAALEAGPILAGPHAVVSRIRNDQLHNDAACVVPMPARAPPTGKER